jgi:outer membrane lipoprotein SlyB
MIQKYDEFYGDDIQLNESQEKMVNEAAEIIAEKIKNGEDLDEGLLGSVVGGLAGVTVGPAIGRAICKALGITSGLLYDLFNSRIFTTAVAAYIGYKN